MEATSGLPPQVLQLLSAGAWEACMQVLQQQRPQATPPSPQPPAQLEGTPTPAVASAGAGSPKHPQPSIECAAVTHTHENVQPSVTPAPSRVATQAMAICMIHAHAAAGRWQALLGLHTNEHDHGGTNEAHGGLHHASSHASTTRDGSTSARTPHAAGAGWASSQQQGTAAVEAGTAAAVRRACRLTAALVHPDKCSLPHASSAFQLVLQAQEQCLRSLQPAGATPPLHATDDDTDSKEEGDRVGEEGEDGARWWEPWEDIKSKSTAASVHLGPSTEPSGAEEEEDQGLWVMSLEELRAEVKRRQAAIFTPQPTPSHQLPTPTASTAATHATTTHAGTLDVNPHNGTTADAPPAPLTMHQRQRRLRYARTVLSQRTARGSTGGPIGMAGQQGPGRSAAAAAATETRHPFHERAQSGAEELAGGQTGGGRDSSLWKDELAQRRVRAKEGGEREDGVGSVKVRYEMQGGGGPASKKQRFGPGADGEGVGGCTNEADTAGDGDGDGACIEYGDAGGFLVGPQ